MTNSKPFVCVNCGKPAAALFKSYGPTVLKLTKCAECGGIVDKYVEYDTVIVMIDLVLMSREAERHILYNTGFESYWKLFIILTMFETYGVWRNDSLVTITIDSLCAGEENSNNVNATGYNSTHLRLPYQLSAPASWRGRCEAWIRHVRNDGSDIFIWEKDFYIQFVSTCLAIAAFIATIYCLMTTTQYISSAKSKAILPLLKAVSLARATLLLTAPALVWAADTAQSTRALHYLMVFLYSAVLFYNVLTVLYARHWALTALVLVASYYAKFQTTFIVTPLVRSWVT